MILRAVVYFAHLALKKFRIWRTNFSGLWRTKVAFNGAAHLRRENLCAEMRKNNYGLEYAFLRLRENLHTVAHKFVRQMRKKK